MRKMKATLVCFAAMILVFANVFGNGIVKNRSSNNIGFEKNESLMNSIDTLDSSTLRNKIINLDYPYFTLKAIVIETDDHKPLKIMSQLKEDLKQIGIGLDIFELDWPTMMAQLVALYDFDICYVALTGNNLDPDFSGMYDESGSLNLFGYNTSMDWDEGLGTGINEWYIQEGKVIMPPDSSERIMHYWNWQNYLMNQILPLIPLTAFNEYCVQYSNLEGFDYQDGLIQSWGKMYWNGYHTGQISLDELVVSKPQWNNLNPLFQDEIASKFISDACMDPLVWFDSDASCWPHIISDWTHINDTHVRLSIREDIKWQLDPEGLFPDEYLDARDVFFTLYSWKHVSNDQNLFDWLEDMSIVDDMTLDIYVDGDPGTLQNEPFNYLPSLSTSVLPEHYLNQTQMLDYITPDITHPSWNNFSNHCFGTGILQFNNTNEGEHTFLSRFDDCWKLDSVITADPYLDFTQRFGDIWGIDDLLIRHDISEENTQYEFDIGSIDLYEFSDADYLYNDYYYWDSQFVVQSKIPGRLSFFGFNMREERGTPMQSRDPCFLEPALTQGLAIRKAIAYAFNKTKMVEYVLDTPQNFCYHPIYNTMEIWLSPNINKYEYDYDSAVYFMLLAGFNLNQDSDGDGFSDFEELNVYQTDPFDENDYPPGPFFGITILCPDSNPMRIETAILFATELPKIGICVEDFIVTDWTHISSRTWGHIGPYPVPTYDEGGFDMLFVGWGQGIDYTNGENFISDRITPNGDNLYQFSNEAYDLAFNSFQHSYENVDKIFWAKELQAILHEEMPSIPTIYSTEFYAFDDYLEGYDLRQWRHTYKGIENWMISGQTEFHYAQCSGFCNFYIISTFDVGDLQWLKQIYDGLLYREPSTNLLVPRLATACSTTDGLTYHITLNPAISWADGTPLTAADVNYSYSLHSFYDWWVDDLIDTITIINDYELEITFTVDEFSVQEILTKEIIPKHIWEGIDPEYQNDVAMDWAINHPENIFGTGPYRLGNYDSMNSIIHLIKNTYFADWNEEAYFDDVYFEYYGSNELALDDLQNGIIDMIDFSYGLTLEDLDLYGVAYDSTITGSFQEIALNNIHPYYGTGDLCPIVGAESAKYIRKAMCHLVDRERICDEIYNDTAIPASSHYCPLSDLFNDELIPCEYNLQTAKIYMGMAGFYIDSDNDGLTDIDEVTKYYTDPAVADADLDSDGDGLTNVDEVDTYLTDPLDADTDDDTMLDGWEVFNGLDPLIDDSEEDPDSDGLTNEEEHSAGTDPHNPDSDGDGLLDGDEVKKYYTDPTVSDANCDSDSDGLTNVEEVDTYLTDPLNADTDGDTLTDGDEVNVYCTDPCDCDSDDDTIPDCEEVILGTDGFITDPNDADTDGDGIDDAEEIANGTDPTDPTDPPTSSPTPTETTTTSDTGDIEFVLMIPIFLLGMLGLIFIRKNRK